MIDLQWSRVIELEKKLVASKLAQLVAKEVTKRAKARAMVDKSTTIYEAKLWAI